MNVGSVAFDGDNNLIKSPTDLRNRLPDEFGVMLDVQFFKSNGLVLFR